MKIRNSFVSNSSSSSFIIAYKPEAFEDLDPCPHCGFTAPNFLDEVNDSRDGDTCFENLEEALNWEDNPELEVAVKDYLNNGYIVQALDLSYHDRDLNRLFTKLINNGKIILIEGNTYENS